MKYLLPVLALFALNLSCKKPQAFLYRDVRNINIENVLSGKPRVSLDLLFYNPNKYGVTLKNVNCDLYVDSSFVGNYVLDTSMFIPRLSEFSLPAKVDVDMKTIFKNSLSALFNNEVLIGARGHARVGKGIIYVTVPFSYQGKQRFNLY